MTKQEQVTILEESVKRLAVIAASTSELTDLRLQAERQIVYSLQQLREFGV